MPDPAAMHRWREPLAAPGRGPKAPRGACTSTVSPGRTSRTSQEEKEPPGISRTPIRGDAPTGAQIE